LAACSDLESLSPIDPINSVKPHVPIMTMAGTDGLQCLDVQARGRFGYRRLSPTPALMLRLLASPDANA
jgi:hypothetical protein